MSELQALRATYRSGKEALLARVQAPGFSARSVHKLLRQLAAQTDGLLIQLWNQAGLGAPCALLAVGGYGRGELFPYSDVDVLVLLPDAAGQMPDPERARRIEGFIGNCWDAGLEIGSSVRTLSECLGEAAKDVTVQTALLESRCICGDQALASAFKSAFMAALDPRAFFIAKTLELRQRHTKFEDTPYALEPNCKESPGGIRDLQAIIWVAKAAQLGSNWQELQASGLATALEIAHLERNQALLFLIRVRLHLAAQRREDRLVFDLQTAVAHSFGYTHTGGEGRALVRASEALMKRYYWAAKAVTQLNQILLMNIEERLNPSTHSLRPINARFNDKAGMLDVVSDEVYHLQPHAILETFLLYQQTVGIKGLSSRTLRALYNARALMDSGFRRDPVNRATFSQILMQPQGITHAMRLMNQTSVLGRYLWVFRRIVGQMQHDLFHVYTVDQHILTVLRNVRRFFVVEHAHEYPLCSQLAAGWDKPWVLYIAALFHDIAKGRGGDHSELGCLEARRFCKLHGIGVGDTALIEFLVAQHLTMSRVAQKSDLSDVEVIAQFAKRVGNERNLTALYLLTVADIRGTSPKVWNAWKGKLLEDLYRYSARVLGGRAPDAQAEVESRKREALVMLALHALPFESHKALWETLDVSYFMRHDAAAIAWHAKQLSRHVDAQTPIVRARRSAVGEGLQVLVYTRDQPDLFARICGYFDQASFSVVDARIHTTQRAYALDTFEVVTSAGMEEHYQALTNMIEADLAQAIALAGPLPAPRKGRVSRRVKSFPIAPRVTLRPDEKAQNWLLNISASDRLGLLYSIARVLAQHHIVVQLAKVATLGERVEDTFLIHGAPLQHNKTQIAIETELLEALAS
ncbi:MAG: [protein-PII] uridylyltransferase [Rhodoferax sp.]|nr:[protein-PII] uridylyltransferase [Rhodoferax sp.]